MTHKVCQRSHFTDDFGLDLGTQEKDLAKGTPNIYARIIRNEIEQQLAARNGGRKKSSRIEYQQLLNFHYADDAQMLSVGGILFDDGQRGHVAKCGFDKLSFYRAGEEPFVIDVPQLTYREIRHLDRQLPADSAKAIQAESIPASDVEKYVKVYRYFPVFAETEV